MKILLKWFRINSLQANPVKLKFTNLGEKKRNLVKLIINSAEIEENKKAVLLGITIDNLLKFNEHIDKLCHTANYKLNALRRMRKNETFMQRIYKCIYKLYLKDSKD